jgi:anti-sigma factor RsiW
MEPRARRRQHCLDLLAELSAYLDGELSPARCRAIERHLDACPCCDRFADGLRRAVAVCQQAGVRRLPRDVRTRAQQRIDALLEAAPPAPARRARPPARQGGRA